MSVCHLTESAWTDSATTARARCSKLKQPIARRAGAPTILVPVLRMSAVQSSFSLADITDTDRFRKLGRSLATDLDGELSRTLVSARVVVGRDGVKRTELVTSGAADRVRSDPTLFGEGDLRLADGAHGREHGR